MKYDESTLEQQKEAFNKQQMFSVNEVRRIACQEVILVAGIFLNALREYQKLADLPLEEAAGKIMQILTKGGE